MALESIGRLANHGGYLAKSAIISSGIFPFFFFSFSLSFFLSFFLFHKLILLLQERSNISLKCYKQKTQTHKQKQRKSSLTSLLLKLEGLSSLLPSSLLPNPHVLFFLISLLHFLLLLVLLLIFQRAFKAPRAHFVGCFKNKSR